MTVDGSISKIKKRFSKMSLRNSTDDRVYRLDVPNSEEKPATSSPEKRSWKSILRKSKTVKPVKYQPEESTHNMIITSVSNSTVSTNESVSSIPDNYYNKKNGWINESEPEKPKRRSGPKTVILKEVDLRPGYNNVNRTGSDASLGLRNYLLVCQSASCTNPSDLDFDDLALMKS